MRSSQLHYTPYCMSHCPTHHHTYANPDASLGRKVGEGISITKTLSNFYPRQTEQLG